MNEDKDGRITDENRETKDPYEGMNREQRRKAMRRSRKAAGRAKAKQHEEEQRRNKK